MVFQQPKVDLRVGMPAKTGFRVCISANKDLRVGIFRRQSSEYFGVSVDKLLNWYLKKTVFRVGILRRQTSELVS